MYEKMCCGCGKYITEGVSYTQHMHNRCWVKFLFKVNRLKMELDCKMIFGGDVEYAKNLIKEREEKKHGTQN